MAKITTPLTNTEIKQAKSKDKEYNLTDGMGLFLRVKPSGSKLWIFNYYQPYSKKRKNMSLGIYPDISLASARQLRDEYRTLISKKIDPQAHRKEQDEVGRLAYSQTLKNIAEKWYDIKRSSVTEDHANKSWASLELHVFPGIGDFPITKITAVKVISILSPLSAQGKLETVKRLTQRINEVMIFAVNSGLIENNPLANINKAFKNPTKSSMATIKPEELPGFIHALNKASIKIVTRCLIEWQLHTLTRPTEAATARWDEIDFENRTWTIPAEKMKMRREHVIPLTDQTIAILEELQPISSHREYLFPAERNPRTHINKQTANMAIKRMGYENKLVAHGLRALGSTILNEQSFDYDVIEAALAHTDKNQVRAAYNRANYLKRRALMMQWWSEHIEQAIYTKPNTIERTSKNLKLVNH